MTQKKEVLIAYLENMPKQFGWVKITPKLDSQNETENLLMELKGQGEINDYQKKYSNVLPIYRRTLEGFNTVGENYTWEIKFSFLSIVKSKLINLI